MAEPISPVAALQKLVHDELLSHPLPRSFTQKGLINQVTTSDRDPNTPDTITLSCASQEQPGNVEVIVTGEARTYLNSVKWDEYILGMTYKGLFANGTFTLTYKRLTGNWDISVSHSTEAHTCDPQAVIGYLISTLYCLSTNSNIPEEKRQGIQALQEELSSNRTKAAYKLRASLNKMCGS